MFECEELGRVVLDGAMGLVDVNERGLALLSWGTGLVVAGLDGPIHERDFGAQSLLESPALAGDGRVAVEVWSESAGRRVFILGPDGETQHLWDVATPAETTGLVLAWAGPDAIWRTDSDERRTRVALVEASTGRVRASASLEGFAGCHFNGFASGVSASGCLLTLDGESGVWPFECRATASGELTLRALTSEPGEANPVRCADGSLLTLTEHDLVVRDADGSQRVGVRDPSATEDSIFGLPVAIDVVSADVALVWRAFEPPLQIDWRAQAAIGPLPLPESAHRFAGGCGIAGTPEQVVMTFQRDDDTASLTELVYLRLGSE